MSELKPFLAACAIVFCAVAGTEVPMLLTGRIGDHPGHQNGGDDHRQADPRSDIPRIAG